MIAFSVKMIMEEPILPYKTQVQVVVHCLRQGAFTFFLRPQIQRSLDTFYPIFPILSVHTLSQKSVSTF